MATGEPGGRGPVGGMRTDAPPKRSEDEPFKPDRFWYGKTIWMAKTRSCAVLEEVRKSFAGDAIGRRPEG
jgi:hypothetical protein